MNKNIKCAVLVITSAAMTVAAVAFWYVVFYLLTP